MVDVFQITEQEGKFYISPLSADMNGKYLIECASKANAKEVRQRLINRSLPLPIEKNAPYKQVGEINGTPIYRVH
jgi:hypothetical protein